MRRLFLTVTCAAALSCHAAALSCHAAALAAPSWDATPEVAAARKARDQASTAELEKLVANARREAETAHALDAYLRLALFEVWTCEAAEAHNDDALVKRAAQAGVAAAERAVALGPDSSDAHQLLGDLLGQLIPHVFGGGMRYGRRSTDELERAIELNPKNANAYVSRAIGYYYTPELFGGSKSKAFEALRKAVEIDPAQDAPHIWLAVFSLDAGRRDDALAEINLALRADPDRAFTKYVQSQINAANSPRARRGARPAKKPSAKRSKSAGR
jgi:tetratricopeptide (TPR) repeat protein